jgi:hypothetical protein
MKAKTGGRRRRIGQALHHDERRLLTVALELLRKEKPVLPPAKPPAKPSGPGGLRAPGSASGGGKLICGGRDGEARPSAGLRPAGMTASARDAAEQTLLESPAQKSLRKPGALGGKSMHLSVVEGEDKGASFDVTGVGTYTIGRKECDIVLNDEKVSRKHASIIVVSGEQYAVADLASRNGTFVNGIRLTRRNLQHNDLVRIGNTTLRFTVFDGPVRVES